jgi:hypothetical protein
LLALRLIDKFYPMECSGLSARIFTFSLLLGCCKSAHDTGEDLAKKKLEVAEGVADGVKEKGRIVGRKGVEGVGELVRGIGAAVKDQINPAIHIELGAGIEKSTFKITRANIAMASEKDRVASIDVEFQSSFEGILQLLALDKQNKEVGRSRGKQHHTYLAGTEKTLTYPFAAELHLTDVVDYQLIAIAPKIVATEIAHVKVSQLDEDGQNVAVYFVFSTALKKALQLRALDGAGQEIARSAPSAIAGESDSAAARIAFAFPPGAPLAAAAKYVVYAVATSAKPAKS